MTLTAQAINTAVAAALAEDAPWGDLTGDLLLPASAAATAELVAREPGVMAGGAVFAAAFALCAAGPGATPGAIPGPSAGPSATPGATAGATPDIEVELLVADGERFAAGQALARVSGPARAVLRAERVALNFVQRLTGIATLTAQFVTAVAGTKAKIVDTRKTTPGLRAFERHAVVCGGGRNHRFGLSDAVMAKDNHLAVLAAGGIGLTDALRSARERLGHTVRFEVEVDRLEQIEPVLAAGVDIIMLDNFTLDQLHAGVALIAGRAIVEASGGVNLATVAAIAATGVDVISVGALTHSARALDLGLDVVVSS